MKRFLFGFALLASFGLTAQSQAQKLTPDAKTVAKTNTRFATDLYAELAKKDGNLFLSPYSISSALGMTYAGARGQTADEMANTLHFGLDPARLHPAFGEITHAINKPGVRRDYQLTVANALWGQADYGFDPNFIKLTQESYGAGLREVDFMRSAEDARKAINDWVEKETKDRIKDLVPKGALTPLTRLVLTNAIYFKGGWAREFTKEATKDQDFLLAGGGKATVKMMHKGEKLMYMAGDKFEAVSIPYRNHELSMLVFLPKSADGLPALEKQLTAENIEAWMTKMKQHEVDLKLPRFKFTSKFGLNDALSSLGMKTAFMPGKADFSGMTTREKLYIQAALHQAFVAVDEVGTEAAAATAIIVGVTSLPPPLPKATFHADRPFVFAIRENATGSVLFMGRVANPAKE